MATKTDEKNLCQKFNTFVFWSIPHDSLHLLRREKKKKKKKPKPLEKRLHCNKYN